MNAEWIRSALDVPNYVFVESSGERIGLAEERQGAVDGGGGTRQGQTEKVPKTPRTPKVK